MVSALPDTTFNLHRSLSDLFIRGFNDLAGVYRIVHHRTAGSPADTLC